MLNVSIVTYNTPKQMLLKALESILPCSSIDTIYIVDNSKNEKIKEYLPIVDSISYINTEKNRGYGYGHNIAIKKSINKGIKYHLVLNPDVYFDPKILEKIILFMDGNPKVGNLMPKIFYPDFSLQYLCKLLPTPYDWIGRRFNPVKSVVEKRNKYFELRFTGYSSIMEAPYLSGCFMFLKVNAIKEIGFFDERIFMYGEETDLCRRLIRGGYKTIFFPEVYAIHEFQKGSHKSLKFTWIGIKSAIYYFNKWGWFFDFDRIKINRSILMKLKSISS